LLDLGGMGQPDIGGPAQDRRTLGMPTGRPGWLRGRGQPRGL
jgi:hypothetical protein